MFKQQVFIDTTIAIFVDGVSDAKILCTPGKICLDLAACSPSLVSPHATRCRPESRRFILAWLEGGNQGREGVESVFEFHRRQSGTKRGDR